MVVTVNRESEEKWEWIGGLLGGVYKTKAEHVLV